MTVFDLGSVHLITDRPDAGPAPTAGPGDPDEIPTGPWAPTQRPTVDELIARSMRTRADLTAAVAQSRRARGADTDDLKAVA